MEHCPPAHEMIAGDFLDFVQRARRAEISRAAICSAGSPFEYAIKRPRIERMARSSTAAFFHRQLAMALNQRPFLRRLGRRQQFAGREDNVSSGKKSRANSSRRARSWPRRCPIPPFALRHVSGTEKVAVADHRDGDGSSHLRDHFPIGRAGITLRTGPSVHGEGGDA